ncbi:glycoside hydrolase family 3 protein [Paenibacillus marinisediminis]
MVILAVISYGLMENGADKLKQALGIPSAFHTVGANTTDKQPIQAGDKSTEHSSPSAVGLSDSNEQQKEDELEREKYERAAQLALNKLDLKQKIGQMLYVDISAVSQEQPQVELPAALEQIQPGGVILFREQFQAPDQTVRVTSLLQHLNVSVPVWIGTDQEGGLVTRVSYASAMNGNMALAATGDPELTTETARRTGEMLQHLGLNMNFAPVADVNVNPDNPVIGIRSFGASPERVGEFVKAYIAGMHSIGMPAAVKHFPGHGDTAVDSHLGLPVLNHTPDQMERTDWVPFREAIASGVDIVMMGHVTVPSLDNTQVKSKQDGKSIYLPATLSKAIVTDVLREQLKFDGVVMTDAMNMGAIAEHFGSDEAAVRAVQAGVDVILMPPNPVRVQERLLKEVRAGVISEERINESVLRILRMKTAYGLLDEEGNPVDVQPYEKRLAEAEQWQKDNDDAAFARRVADQAVTYVGESNQLPFLTEQVKRVVLVGTDSYALKEFSAAIMDSMSEQASSSTRTLNTLTKVVKTESDISAIIKQLDQKSGTDVVLVISRDAQLQSKQRKLLQSALDQLSKTKVRYGLIATSSPYDVDALSGMPFSIAAYGLTEANLRAAAGLLWKQEPTAAHMPITP